MKCQPWFCSESLDLPTLLDLPDAQKAGLNPYLKPYPNPNPEETRYFAGVSGSADPFWPARCAQHTHPGLARLSDGVRPPTPADVSGGPPARTPQRRRAYGGDGWGGPRRFCARPIGPLPGRPIRCRSGDPRGVRRRRTPAPLCRWGYPCDNQAGMTSPIRLRPCKPKREETMRESTLPVRYHLLVV